MCKYTLNETAIQHEMAVQRRLAPYASNISQTHRRLYNEPDSSNRSPFQRDRDRIIHCSAFRRLNYKTQVFVYHEGDHYRSRLTHSLEVAQIARTLSRTLGLDEDLAETLALAHDLGHPPFGHAGERALSAVMQNYGGFDHNAQSLRVVTKLERKYAEFDGLNLTWETLEGLVKHNGPLVDNNQEGSEQKTPIIHMINDYCKHHDLKIESYASAEAQVAAMADDIAYNNHDIDDALRAGLIVPDGLKQIPLTARLLEEVDGQYPNLEQRRLIYEINRRLITEMVTDLAEETRKRLSQLKPKNVDDIRNADAPVSCFSDIMTYELNELRSFLKSEVYRSSRIMKIMQNAMAIVTSLFECYMSKPEQLPEDWHQLAIEADETARARLVCDFVAGMTDRYAIAEHQRVFDETPKLR
ncbi:MAG: deoxyguanosinetriphosphate triphosphohydrolase [Pseudomonadota bacterium]